MAAMLAGPDVEDHEAFIEMHCAELIDIIDLKNTKLWEYVAQRGIMSYGDVQYIRDRNASNRDQVRELLHHLRRRPITDFITFQQLWRQLNKGNRNAWWKQVRFLGAGAFGKVFLCTNLQSGKSIARKVVSCSTDQASVKEIEALKREIQLLQKLRHPNIVEYYWMEKNDHELSLFMEYMSQGSVKNRLNTKGALNLKETRVVTKQALEGLKFLHEQRIVHRDIKCANILWNSTNDVKLCDFGTAKRLKTISNQKSFVGTFHWMAPEVVKKDEYGRAADIWSMGCTVVEMLTTTPPWNKLEDAAALFRIGSTTDWDKPDYDLLKVLPKERAAEAEKFLSLCLCKVPADRRSAEDLLAHEFFQDIAAM